MAFIVATTSLAAVDRPNADLPNAARSRQKYNICILKMDHTILHPMNVQ